MMKVVCLRRKYAIDKRQKCKKTEAVLQLCHLSSSAVTFLLPYPSLAGIGGFSMKRRRDSDLFQDAPSISRKGKSCGSGLFQQSGVILCRLPVLIRAVLVKNLKPLHPKGKGNQFEPFIQEIIKL